MNPRVTVVIPTMPSRKILLQRAVNSVLVQTYPHVDYKVSIDFARSGSAVTRNRALDRATGDFVAFLDDDDFLLPNHIALLVATAQETGADVVYPGCRVVDRAGKEIPLQEEWGRFGKEFDGDLLMKKSYIPVTSLCRTDMAKRARFGPPFWDPTSPYDDWGFYTRMYRIEAAHFFHLPQTTWVWSHHGRNTSGRSDLW